LIESSRQQNMNAKVVEQYTFNWSKNKTVD